MNIVRNARSALRNQSVLLAQSTGQPLPEAATISELLSSGDLPSRIREVATATEKIDAAYRNRYSERHRQRFDSYDRAIQAFRDQAAVRSIDLTDATQVLAPLLRRAVKEFEVPPYAAADTATGATLATIEDDLDLLPSLQAGAMGWLAQPRDSGGETEEPLEVIRLGDFLPRNQPLADFKDDEIDSAIEKLRQKLYALRELKRRVFWD